MVQDAAASTSYSEVFRNVGIGAGQSVWLDSALDYSQANTVAVALLCTTCTSASTSLTSSGLVLEAFWSVPDADQYSVAENAAAGKFLYLDSGGAVFQVYGPEFRLKLRNLGNKGITIQQITLFRRQ